MTLFTIFAALLAALGCFVFIGLLVEAIINHRGWLRSGIYALLAFVGVVVFLFIVGVFAYTHGYFGSYTERAPITNPFPGGNTGAGESSSLTAPAGMPAGVKIYGDVIVNVCDIPADGYPSDQIEILWTDGIKRPDGAMGLDLNSYEVGNGDYYLFFFPLGSGGHAYDADGHFTYEVHGGQDGTYVLATAITGWCHYDETNDWDTETEMRPGMVQFHPVDGDICAASAWKWVEMPSNGKLPKPDCSGSATTPESSLNTNESVTSDLASCEMPSGDTWTWEGNYWKYDSTTATTFTVPEWIEKADFYNGQLDKSDTALSGEKVVNANTVSAFCK